VKNKVDEPIIPSFDGETILCFASLMYNIRKALEENVLKKSKNYPIPKSIAVNVIKEMGLDGFLNGE